MIVEHAFVLPSGRHTPTQIGVCSDSHVPGLGRLPSAVRAEGAVVALQLAHAGSSSCCVSTPIRTSLPPKPARSCQLWSVPGASAILLA